MLNPLSFFSKIIKSSNQRELDRLGKIVSKINDLEETTKNLVIKVKDEGPGFSETSPQKIFKRFYSNRPKNFGKHSGLGLNIVKNIVELHKGTIAASNRLNTKGAQVEVLLPKFI